VNLQSAPFYTKPAPDSRRHQLARVASPIFEGVTAGGSGGWFSTWGAARLAGRAKCCPAALAAGWATLPPRRRAAVAVALTQTNCWRELAVTAIHLAPVGSPITIQLARHALPIIEAVTAGGRVGCCYTWGAAVLAVIPMCCPAALAAGWAALPPRRRAAVAVALTQTNCWRELAVTAIHLAPVAFPITIQLARHAKPIIEAVTAGGRGGCCSTWGAAIVAGLPVLSSTARVFHSHFRCFARIALVARAFTVACAVWIYPLRGTAVLTRRSKRARKAHSLFRCFACITLVARAFTVACAVWIYPLRGTAVLTRRSKRARNAHSPSGPLQLATPLLGRRGRQLYDQLLCYPRAKCQSLNCGFWFAVILTQLRYSGTMRQSVMRVNLHGPGRAIFIALSTEGSGGSKWPDLLCNCKFWCV
jgi:hypothetical protein